MPITNEATFTRPAPLDLTCQHCGADLTARSSVWRKSWSSGRRSLGNLARWGNHVTFLRNALYPQDNITFCARCNQEITHLHF